MRKVLILFSLWLMVILHAEIDKFVPVSPNQYAYMTHILSYLSRAWNSSSLNNRLHAEYAHSKSGFHSIIYGQL